MSADSPPDPFRRGSLGGPRRGRAIIPTILVLVVLAILFAVFTSFWTERLWFTSVGRVDVFTTTLLTRVGLFVVFAALMAGTVIVNSTLAYRLRPRYRPMSVEQQSLDRYRDALDPVRRWVVIGVAGLAALMAGGSASGEWSAFLQWRNSQSFGVKDPQFGMDVSFYVFSYPWFRFLIGFGFALVVVGFLVALVTHYVYGGIRLQTVGDKVTSGAQAHLSVLVGLFVLLKAVSYWLDRYGLLTSEHSLTNGFTGATYSDLNALLPANTFLAVIALVCALLFFANVVRRSFTLPVIGLGLLVLSAVLLGGVYPAIVQQFQVRPSEPSKEAQPISRNIAATRDAYGLTGVKVTSYAPTRQTKADQLKNDAETLPGIRLLDPNVVSPTFQQLQQVRPFYQFPDPLDVDRYNIRGKTADVDVAVRDLDLNGIPDGQRSWVNDHTVYTHGYGFFAAYGNRRNADGTPVFVDNGDGGEGSELGTFEPRIYFGESSPEYSIVGAPQGAKPVEYDVPDAATANTYDSAQAKKDGGGGVPIGSFFTKLLYAAKFQEGNILLSDRLNDQSQILYDRGPRERVEKVAPWLTVDGDPFPAVVGGKVVWIVDGYTTLDDYPYAQRVALDAATTDTRAARANVGQQQQTVNYVRNSVKATVDAYSGKVTLYQWDEKDPVLKVWRKVFPQAVQDKSSIPTDLRAHFRYPQDLFKVQRQLLSKYHVTNPSAFYGGQEVWIVPDDPSPGRGTAPSTLAQPPYYLTVKMPPNDDAAFSLTTTFTRKQPPNLAAFMAVNADAANPDDYGTIRVLELSSERTALEGPGQVANSFETDQAIANATLALRNSGARTDEGNLLTLPVGGGFLYVQPLYVERSSGSGSYPLLRLVFVAFGDKVGVGNTLEEALNQVFSGESGGTGSGDGTGTVTPPKGGTGSAALKQAVADANRALQDSTDALKTGNFTEYGAALKRLQAALTEAARLSGTASGTQSPSTPASGTGTGSPSATASP